MFRGPPHLDRPPKGGPPGSSDLPNTDLGLTFEILSDSIQTLPPLATLLEPPIIETGVVHAFGSRSKIDAAISSLSLALPNGMFDNQRIFYKIKIKGPEHLQHKVNAQVQPYYSV